MFTLAQFTNNAALILPPEANQHWSKISPLAAFKRFTLRWWRVIGALTPNPNASVNGVSDMMPRGTGKATATATLKFIAKKLVLDMV